MNIKFIKALNKFKVLNLFNVNGTISLNKVKFTIPILQKTGFSNLFMSETWMIDLLEIILPIENKKFIDVGINIGQTLLKLKSVSSEIEYIGFEPNPICVSYINQLVKKNNFKRTSVIPVGISDKTGIGILNFFYPSSTDASASMIPGFRPEHKINRKEFIPLFDLERLKESINLDFVSVLKIDVEGAELEVLSSFKHIIKNKLPIILIEILPAYDDKNLFRIERQNKIQTLLWDAEYSIHRVIKENDILISLEEISEIGIHADMNKCEYVMVPNIKKEKFKKYCQQKLTQQ